MAGRRNYEVMTIAEKEILLLTKPQHVDPTTVKYKINADFIWFNIQNEC